MTTMPLSVLNGERISDHPVLSWCDGLTPQPEVARILGPEALEAGLRELKSHQLLHPLTLPARVEGLIVNDFGQELLIFDPRTQQAHHLTAGAALVFRHCDGRTSVAELLQHLDAQSLRQILFELEQKRLLQVPSGLDRRHFLSNLARLAATLPLISSVLAPSPSDAVSVENVPGQAAVGPEAKSGEDYAHLPENEFLAVDRYPQSTFSVDVDTASYANVRRFLKEGKLPPPDAVRIEEMVNYFAYDYSTPEDKRPFAVSTEVSQCPWNSEHQLMRIGLQAAPLSGELPARNLVFLLDVSGSMSDSNKLPLLKKALRSLLDTFTQSDKVAIVVYAGSSGLVLPATVGSEKERIQQALDKLEAGGSTNGAEGIQLAYRVARENLIPKGVNRVILATDGDFNVGTTSQHELLGLIEEQRKSGIFLTVLGLGMGNLKDSTLEMLADKGNGNYAYLDNLAEARKVLVKEGGATLVTVAKDVKIQVEFNPKQVSAYRLIGYENRLLKDEDFKDDKKDAGEIGAGHRVTALYELIRPGQPDLAANAEPLRYQSERGSTAVAATAELCIVKVRFKPPHSDTSQQFDHPVTPTTLRSTDFVFAAAVAAFGMLLRKSKFSAQANYGLVLELAGRSLGTDSEGYRREFVELVKKAQSLA